MTTTAPTLRIRLMREEKTPDQSGPLEIYSRAGEKLGRVVPYNSDYISHIKWQAQFPISTGGNIPEVTIGLGDTPESAICDAIGYIHAKVVAMQQSVCALESKLFD